MKVLNLNVSKSSLDPPNKEGLNDIPINNVEESVVLLPSKFTNSNNFTKVLRVCPKERFLDRLRG